MRLSLFLKKYFYIHVHFSKKIDEIKENLVAYKPSVRANVQTANILLLGEIGAGKSSFFNSVNSAFRGKLTCKACCGGFGHSATTMVCIFSCMKFYFAPSKHTLFYRSKFEKWTGQTALWACVD